VKLRITLAALAVLGSTTALLETASPVSAADPVLIAIDSLGGHFNSAQAATCGIDNSGTGGTQGSVWCWGANSSGQLGDGTTTYSANPVRVSANPSAGFTNTQVTHVSVGNTSACAIEGGVVYCWGRTSPGSSATGRPLTV
jgi:hypothetical protein